MRRRRCLPASRASGASSPTRRARRKSISRGRSSGSTELGDRPSLLNPLWYAGSFAIGIAAGFAGDRVNLGFVVETERQVEKHLTAHMERLPAADAKSRAIVEKMRDDEARHGAAAQGRGRRRAPVPGERTDARRGGRDALIAYRV